MSQNTIHASCVAIAEKGILIVGESGSGKSDIALQLIDAGAELVSDDQTALSVKDGRLIASAPASIAGLIEVRNIGLLRLPFRSTAYVSLYVELVPESKILARMPEDDSILLLDHAVRRLRLHCYAASTPAKIRAALAYSLVTDY